LRSDLSFIARIELGVTNDVAKKSVFADDG
jgi:hypothetical protein